MERSVKATESGGSGEASPDGVVVSASDSSLEDPGSIPGLGNFLFLNCTMLSCLSAYHTILPIYMTKIVAPNVAKRFTVNSVGAIYCPCAVASRDADFPIRGQT